MTHITWTEILLVGHKALDDQHKNLIGIINRFLTAADKGYSPNELESILHDLVDFTREHFNTEEKMMKEWDYSEYADHKREHERLIGDIDEFRQKFQNGQTEITAEVVDFLNFWFNPLCY